MFAKLKQNWGLTLFALPFAGVGLGVLFFSLLPALIEWQSMKSWQAVDARVLYAELKTSRDDGSNTYQATASYRYTFNSIEYENERVAIMGGSDNIGDFQQALSARLTFAYHQQQSVSAWVDPHNPADAILNREMRWELFGFKLVFVLLFGGVGLCLILWTVCAQPTATNHPESPTKPWLAQREWASDTIQCNAKAGLWMVWALALIWNLISSFLWCVIPGELAKGNYLIFIAALFPLVGLGLLYWAIKVTLEWRRFGMIAVTLDPYPGAIGGHVGGRLELPLAYHTSHKFPLTLSCIHSYMSGSGEDRSRKESVKWQTQGFAYSDSSARGTGLSFRFDVPQDLPASGTPQDDYYLWRLDIKADLPGVDLNRQFNLPVFPTAEPSRFLLQDAADHPDAVEFRTAMIESVLDLRQVSGGVELYFPMLRNAGMKVGWMLFSAIFGGAGIALLNSNAPVVLATVFTLIGAVAFVACIYSLFNSLNVRLDKEGLWTQRQFLGVTTNKRHYDRSSIQNLSLHKSYSVQSGSEHVEVFSIKALTSEGKKITISESLKGRATAQQALAAISLLSGYPQVRP